MFVHADAAGTPAPADPVDPAHVARLGPGWYHGDFHMHAFHSNADGPDDADFVAQADASEGPLGTFWGLETLDTQTRTTIANPVFLKGP